MVGPPAQGRERGRRPAVAAFDPRFEPLTAVVRGGAVESVHRGVITVVDEAGALLGGAGDPGTPILLRSAAKPFQAAAVVASGAADAFALTDQEIALMAGSHAGSPEHVEVVGRLLARAGIPASAPVCGSLEHMCSGKHAGMLLMAAHLGVPGEGYHHQEHPVQREIRGYVASLLEGCPRKPCRTAAGSAGRPGSRAVFTGIDGCGVPVIAMTLYEAAWLFATLAAGSVSSLARVRDAMLAHPVLVAGEGRLDTNLIRAGAGAIVSKGGAEGVQGLGLPAGAAGTSAVGFAMKIEDGSGRSIPVVATAFLRARGLPREAAAIAEEHSSAQLDVTGREVARIEAVVEESALWFQSAQPAAAETGAVPKEGALPKECAAPDAGTTIATEAPARWWLFGRKGDHLTVSRGVENDVLRFLREQWPAADREYFGRVVEWTADPHSFVYRRNGKIVGVLRGHFIGGLASVDELMVAEGSRGRGLGSLLLGRFEDEARKRKCSRIVLRAVKGTRAEDFYRRRGYHRECVQYGYEFGYDYVRLVCDAERALGETGEAANEGKGKI